MANKDHSLDDGIIQAAYSEFLAYGFQKASLHKIAEKAGVTTGAIYTRYRNKDALFASLLQDFFETMRTLFTPIAEEYEKAKHSAQPEDILRLRTVLYFFVFFSDGCKQGLHRLKKILKQTGKQRIFVFVPCVDCPRSNTGFFGDLVQRGFLKAVSKKL